MTGQIKKHPLVIVANGTGVKASDYSDFFRHLASWGFVVAGNEDPNSRSGASASETLSRVLQENGNSESKLCGRVDLERIAIAGQSQGGVAVVNAINHYDNGRLYCAAYCASITSPFWGQADKLGADWQYDISKLKVPCLMIAGTGFLDAGLATDILAQEGQGISPLYALQENYDQIPNETIKIMARRIGIDHGDIFNASDGYMTAWFLWHLNDDPEAAMVFAGDGAELRNNPLYQDVRINIPDVD